MATINGASVLVARRVLRTSWETLTNGDVGSAAGDARKPEKSVQVFGTFGTSGQVDIEGSNDDGTNWHVLSDPNGTALNITAEGAQSIGENTQLVRPNVSNGDATTDLDVHLVEALG